MAAVLVHIDLDGEWPNASSLMALAAGRHVASSWGATLYAAVVSHDLRGHSTGDAGISNPPRRLDTIETALAHAGADKVVVAVTTTPVTPLWSAIGAAWQGVLDHLRPRLVLFGADSPSAPELAPRTGARIGARLLMRARATGIEDVELRGRDGGYVRASDGGAAVAMIGAAAAAQPGEDDIDLVVVEPATPSEVDARIELVTTANASLAHMYNSIVALGDDVVNDAQLVANARRLAELLGAQLVGVAAAAHAGIIDVDAVVESTTPLAPDLCVTIGNAELDIAGATSLIKIGGKPGRMVDGALSGPVAFELAALVALLEKA